MAKYLEFSETESIMDSIVPEVKPWVGANAETKKVRYISKQA